MLTLALALGLLALGAHVRCPLELARQTLGSPAAEASPPRDGRRIWALAATPLLLLGIIAWLALQARTPSPALGGPSTESLLVTPTEVRLVLLAASSLVLADLFVLAFWPRLERGAWLLYAAVGLIALLVACHALSVLALRELPELSTAQGRFDGDTWIETTQLEAPLGGGWVVLARTCLLALLALAVGEIGTLAVRSGGGEAHAQTAFAVSGSAALVLFLLVLDPPVRAAIIATSDYLTCVAAAALLLLQRWLPRRYREAALAGGSLLAALFLARVVVLS